MKEYLVRLEPKKKNENQIFEINEIQCCVKSESLTDACLKVEDYFSHVLGMALTACSVFRFCSENPEADSEN